MCTRYFTLQLKGCSQWRVTISFQIDLNEDINKTVKREIRSRKMQTVCILKSFSKYLCWHISYVASKITSHDTFPNTKRKENGTSTWQRHSASQAAWLTSSKKKFHREMVCQTQELTLRLRSLLPGVFVTWPDKGLHNCSGFKVGHAQSRGWIRQPPGGSFELKFFCNSLPLHHSQVQLNSAPPTSCIGNGRDSPLSCRATRNTLLDTHPLFRKGLLKSHTFTLAFHHHIAQCARSQVLRSQRTSAVMQIILMPDLSLQQPTFVQRLNTIKILKQTIN